MGTDRCEVESAPNRLILQLSNQTNCPVSHLLPNSPSFLLVLVCASYLYNSLSLFDVGCGIGNNRKEILHGEDLIEEGTAMLHNFIGKYIHIYINVFCKFL